jgi:signal transduction histidine kinase
MAGRTFSVVFYFVIFCLSVLARQAVYCQAQPSPTIKVGVYQNGPKIFFNEDGRPDGFFVHLLNELGARIGFTPEYVKVNWSQGMQAMKEGRLDLMSDVVPTDYRREQYLFNEITVLENWASLYISKNKEPEYYTLQNLSNMRVAYMKGDSNFEAFKKELGRDSASLQFIPLKGYPEVFKALKNKEADLGLVNYYYGKDQESSYQLQKLDIVINPATVHWASNKPSMAPLLRKIDKELCLMKDNKESVYYALIDDFLEPGDTYKFPRWLSILLSGLVIFLFVSLVTVSGLQVKLRHSRENLRSTNQQLERKITEISAAEESLQKKNQELLATNRAMDQLMYRVSHNLRAPLTSVLGLIEVVKLEIPATARQYMEAMEKSIHKLDGTIRDILDYYRNNRTEIAREPVNLAELAKEVYESMAFMNPGVNILLHLDIREECHLVTDPLRLKSVLHNLISNSIKYYNPYTEEPYVAVNAVITFTQAKITISDNGIGIPGAQQDKVFSMFFRGSNSSSGAGLGLYIVKETVERLGGTIHLESKLNQGSNFTILIPNNPN